MSLHPARYSTQITQVVGDYLHKRFPDGMGRPIIHDPFAGTGERLADMCSPARDGWGFTYSGTEIEPAFIVAPGIIAGSATDPATYPPARFPDEAATGGWIVFTSPVYPNGMADSHRPRDDSKRYNYRVAKMKITGNEDAELHPDNMGGYGYRGTRRDGNSVRRKRYWEIAKDTVALWDSAMFVIVNVSDFATRINGAPVIEPLVDDWANMLYTYGWERQQLIPVGTPRMRNGENADVRIDHEMIIIGERP